MAESLRLLLVHAPDDRARAIMDALTDAGHVVSGPVASAQEALELCARQASPTEGTGSAFDLALVQQSTNSDMAAMLVGAFWRRGPLLSMVLLDTDSPAELSAVVAAEPLGIVPAGASTHELLAMVRLAARQRAALAHARDPDARFFSVAIDMLCFLDFSGFFRRLSPSWERTLGFTREELMSRPFIEFVHPDDRQRTLAQNRLVREGGQAVGFENRYLCKDGSHRWFRWNAAADVERNVIYSVARDITDARMASEERERLIEELQQALAEVKSLQAIIPICSYCKKVRDDDDYWQHVESYIHTHTGARFSHGVCPGCFESVVRQDFPDVV